MAFFSQIPFSIYFSTKPITKPTFSLIPKRSPFSLHVLKSENTSSSSLTSPQLEDQSDSKENKENINHKENSSANLVTNGVLANNAVKLEEPKKFKDERWVKGTWDLNQFLKNGRTDWDSVIDAEARRRKWLEIYPEASNNEDEVYFDTSIIPWYAWIKRYHLPEAEKLNGRAAMIGFFMAYFVDSLTGVGLVDQTSNFFCKTLLFISVVGVLFIRNNEDIENLKKILEETTFYDKQWQATWQDDDSTGSKK